MFRPLNKTQEQIQALELYTQIAKRGLDEKLITTLKGNSALLDTVKSLVDLDMARVSPAADDGMPPPLGVMDLKRDGAHLTLEQLRDLQNRLNQIQLDANKPHSSR